MKKIFIFIYFFICSCNLAFSAENDVYKYEYNKDPEKALEKKDKGFGIQEEKKRFTGNFTVAPRAVFNFHSGDYLRLEKEKNYNNFNVGVTFHMSYDRRINFTRFVNPLVGISFDVSYNFLKQHKVITTSGTTRNMKVGELIGLNMILGNVFKLVDNKFYAKVYGNIGLSLVELGYNVSLSSHGRRYGSSMHVGYSSSGGTRTIGPVGVGYQFGGGIDFLIYHHLVLGLFYSYQQVLHCGDFDFGDPNFDEIPLDKFKSHAFGVSFGIVI